METSVDFQVKYLTNRNVLGRCFLILENQCQSKFGGVDLDNLPYAIASGLIGANLVDDLVDGTIVPSSYAKSLSDTDRIHLIASMDQGMLCVRCEVR